METKINLNGIILPARALLKKVEKAAIQTAEYSTVDDTEMSSWSETLEDALWLFKNSSPSNDYEEGYIVANVQYAYAGLRMAMYNVGMQCLEEKLRIATDERERLVQEMSDIFGVRLGDN